ncbi:hypothetical protein C8J55DRAFT_537639 [Lentinula edodes]|uniref:Uncharacterized protein n=1 Tax=Lentinula lateritia TaxID=40482 RepID=A0A9W9A069_9AGAR|nr:hypothetical protein C8J55DRAFT_537639 [Lentinula edodes]
MQFKYHTLTCAIVTAVSFVNSVNAAAIANTEANLTFIGEPITKRTTEDTMVVYCSVRTQDVCGGACTVYNGGATCLNAPNTNCLSATNNVGFCDRGGCGGSCNQLSTCGVRLDDGFCYTPGTSSINVGF